jgi:hypothetical protein
MGRTATPLYGGKEPNKRPKCETPLGVWIESTGTSRFSLAKQLGCDPKMVQRWTDGRALPGLVYAIELERVTQGGVLVYSWAGTELYKMIRNNNGVDWDVLIEQRRAEQRRNAPRRRRGNTP